MAYGGGGGGGSGGSGGGGGGGAGAGGGVAAICKPRPPAAIYAGLTALSVISPDGSNATGDVSIKPPSIPELAASGTTVLATVLGTDNAPVYPILSARAGVILATPGVNICPAVLKPA